jgi:hypothetical protein
MASWQRWQCLCPEPLARLCASILRAYDAGSETNTESYDHVLRGPRPGGA